MPLDRSAPRHEITYLRRRPKRGEQAAAGRASAGTGGLVIDRGAAAPSAPSTRPVGGRPVEGRTLLRDEARVAKLNRRQAAIGSLSFELVTGGDLSCAWELDGADSGVVSQAVGAKVAPEFERRPIVELLDRRIIVGLRHVRNLRRLLLIGGGASTFRILGKLYDGAMIETTHSNRGTVTVLLAIYLVDGELVVRREEAGFESLEQACREYGFETTWLPPVA